MNPGTANYRLAALAAAALAAFIYLSPIFMPEGVRLPFAPAENPIHLGGQCRQDLRALIRLPAQSFVTKFSNDIHYMFLKDMKQFLNDHESKHKRKHFRYFHY